MSLEFEWDPRKAEINLRKHRVSFREAATVFADELSATFPDPDHSEAEERLLTIGMSDIGRLLIVAYTERENHLRLISARELTTTERGQYEESNH